MALPSSNGRNTIRQNRLMASAAASIEKLVLKQDESFIVSDRRGDFPAHLVGELGFYHRGTRHLRWLEIRLNGERNGHG